MRESIHPMWSTTPGAGSASRWSVPQPGEKRAGRLAFAHRLDEFPAGYSLASCSPAALASASPAGSSMSQTFPADDDSSANGNLSLLRLSHQRGSSHRGVPIADFLQILGFGACIWGSGRAAGGGRVEREVRFYWGKSEICVITLLTAQAVPFGMMGGWRFRSGLGRSIFTCLISSGYFNITAGSSAFS